MSSATVTRRHMRALEQDTVDAPVETAPAEKKRGLVHMIGVGLSAGLLALVALVAILVIIIPMAVGGRALTVLTSSMEPAYPPGSLVLTKPTPVGDIRLGDVLTYQLNSGEAALVTHRVTEVTSGTDGTVVFTTKGDNNDLADAKPVTEVQVVGTVMYAVPYLGWANNAVNGEARQYILPVIVGLLFAYALWMAISAVRDRAKKRRVASENE